VANYTWGGVFGGAGPICSSIDRGLRFDSQAGQTSFRNGCAVSALLASTQFPRLFGT
jgi:hypothetical protein